MQRRLPALAPVLTVATVLAALAVPGPARGDTVILTDGKKLEGVVVSRNDDTGVVINPWNSSHPDMTWEIPDKCRIPRAKVKEVVIEDAPLVEVRRRAVKASMSIEERKELIAYSQKHKLDDVAKVHQRLLLGQELTQQKDDTGTTPPLPPAAKGDPEADPELRQFEREYVALKDPASIDAQWKMMQERATKRPRVYLERARRSAQQPKGRRDKVPLTVRAKEAPGGNYCIYVPTKYDPLVATPLVVALHGGGRGGADPKLVTGNGQEAMNFYQDLAEEWGWVVVCPSALVAGWGSRENEPLVDAIIDEMRMLYNVDETRIYLTGHSMGGYGTWEWAPKRPELWAACAPCAGGGGPNNVDPVTLPTYIYHGTDDNVCGVGQDREAANNFAKTKKADFVYTEIDKIGHGFPDWVRKDIFRFFAGRMKSGKKRAIEPVSSFARKVDKVETLSFGDPSGGGGRGGARGRTTTARPTRSSRR